MYCVKLTKIKKGRRYNPIEVGSFTTSTKAEEALTFLLKQQSKYYKVDTYNKTIYLYPDDNAKMYADVGKRATPYPNSDAPMWVAACELEMERADKKGELK